MNRTDYVFYYIGWGIIGLMILIGVLQFFHIFTLTDIGLPCTFRMVTGHYCPGCGGTHAVCSLAHGHLLKSFSEHAAVPVAGLLIILYVVWNSLITLWNRIIDKKRKGGVKLPALHFHTAYIYVVLAIILIQWMVKLLFF